MLLMKRIPRSRINLIRPSVTHKCKRSTMTNIPKSRIFLYQKLYGCETTEVRINGQRELSTNVLVLCPTVYKYRVKSDMLNSYIIDKKSMIHKFQQIHLNWYKYPHLSLNREPLRVWLNDEVFKIENIQPG